MCAHVQQPCKQQQKVRDHLQPIHTHNAVCLHRKTRFCLTKSGNTDGGYNMEETPEDTMQNKTLAKERKLCDRTGETFLHCHT